MLPLPAVANVVRLTIEGTTPHSPWVNSLHYGYSGGLPTGPDCADFADVLFTAWLTNFGPLMLTSATLERATCFDLSSSLGNQGDQVSHQVGSRGTAELPGSSAVLVKKSVGRRYRGGHPRSYVVAGIATDMADTSHWSSALVAAVTGGYQNVQGALNGHVHGATTLTTEVVVSYFDSVTVPIAPHRRVVPLVLPVTGVAAQPLLATQRRRIGR
jgi:hypothetical protein